MPFPFAMGDYVSTTDYHHWSRVFALMTALLVGCSDADLKKPTNTQSDPSGGSSTSDPETTKSTAPVSVSGAFLVDCGFADDQGNNGCVVVDSVSGDKVKTVKEMSVTASYSDGSQDKPTTTPAPDSDPWHVRFQLPNGKRALLSKISVQASLTTGTTIAQDAVTLSYLPKVTKAILKAAFQDADTIVFITRSSFAPAVDFASDAQADLVCNTAASSPSALVPARTWKAIISSDTKAPADRIGAALGGVLVSSVGSKLADVPASVFSKTAALTTPITLDETGNAQANDSKVWTGTSDLTLLYNGTCGNWSVITGSGGVGVITAVTNLLQSTLQPCSMRAHLYCLSTGKK